MSVPAPTAPNGSAPFVTPLEWDTRHFGFPVGRIDGWVNDEAVLATLLADARRNGRAVVYWFAEEGRSVSTALLERFGGNRVCQRVRFVRPAMINRPRSVWSPGDEGSFSRHDGESGQPLRIAELPRQPASQRLKQLAIAASAQSRFRVDPRFSPASVDHLYEIWMSRSALHEIADVVFVAETGAGEPVAMISAAGRDPEAEIGLLAVDARHRRRQLGQSLLEAVGDWAVHKGFERLTVVTQLENAPACRLYERAGFEAAFVQPVYHFWLQPDADTGRKRPT